MGWIRLVVQRALHHLHGSPAVCLQHKKNFLSSKNKAWKKVMPVRDLNSWPVRYRCSVLPVSHRSFSNPVQVWTFFWPYFHYCSGSVHYCGNRFHIYVFIPRSRREKVICVIREFDFRGDGEKICPYHSPCLTESIIMCIYIYTGAIHIPIYLLRGRGGEHLTSAKLVFITIHGKISFVMNLLFSAW